MKNEIDYTKDHLVITRDENKKFKYFRWYLSEKKTEAEILEAIEKWNNEQKEKYDGLSAELILNPLIREICAYRDHAAPFESVINDAKEVQATIEETENAVDEIIEKLEWCTRELSMIKGLSL